MTFCRTHHSNSCLHGLHLQNNPVQQRARAVQNFWRDVNTLRIICLGTNSYMDLNWIVSLRKIPQDSWSLSKVKAVAAPFHQHSAHASSSALMTAAWKRLDRTTGQAAIQNHSPALIVKHYCKTRTSRNCHNRTKIFTSTFVKHFKAFFF